MKKILTVLGVVAVMLTVSSGASYGQITDQMSIVNIGTDEPQGGYPGYPFTGTLSFTFTHGTGNDIIPGAVRILIQMASGTHLDSAVAGIPSGWEYQRTNPINGYLTNTDTIPAVGSVAPSLPGGYYLGETFHIPFNLDTAQDGTNSIAVGAVFFGIGTALYIQPNVNTATTSVTIQGTPLPVDFASFHATANNCAVDLNWVTSREVNNDHFVVERSRDGRYFSKIGSVKALSGEDVGNREYSFVDEQPYEGNNFYRIRQVDVNGKSVTTKVEEVKVNCRLGHDIAIYPNPTRGIIYVQGLQNAETIEVFNVLGQRVLTQKIKHNTEIVNISELASGNYSLRVIRNQESIFSAKVVKK